MSSTLFSIVYNPRYVLLKALQAALTMTIAAVALSACQPFGTDAASQSTVWSCVSKDLPFRYNACHIDAQALTSDRYQLKLFWQDADKQTLLRFDNVVNTLPSSQTLAFAMNAGMYNERYAPIGYTVIEGDEKRSLNLKEGGGNFHLLPNGVMWWDQTGKMQITESNALANLIDSGNADIWYATQSGPMLVIDGEIHPQFNEGSTSAKYRNGIGICRDGSDITVQMVNSEEPVNFYHFAELFKNDLNCPNALFLDGGIASALYAPSIDKHDKKDMGVIIGVVETPE